jgi:hypothetical protein
MCGSGHIHATWEVIFLTNSFVTIIGFSSHVHALEEVSRATFFVTDMGCSVHVHAIGKFSEPNIFVAIIGCS